MLDKATSTVAGYPQGARRKSRHDLGGRAPRPSGWAAYFGDMNRNQVAVDANTGKELWTVNVDAGPRGILTGAPALWKDTLYVPLSSFEEGVAGLATYECCKQRGAVVAIDTASGKIRWKSYTIPTTPAPFKKNAAGTQMFGPGGRGDLVFADHRSQAKGVLYVATGDSYTDVDGTTPTRSRRWISRRARSSGPIR
jgi:polyvinyl alcohol dehydrogenase (cytochrome)